MWQLYHLLRIMLLVFLINLRPQLKSAQEQCVCVCVYIQEISQAKGGVLFCVCVCVSHEIFRVAAVSPRVRPGRTLWPNKNATSPHHVASSQNIVLQLNCTKGGKNQRPLFETVLLPSAIMNPASPHRRICGMSPKRVRAEPSVRPQKLCRNWFETRWKVGKAEIRSQTGSGRDAELLALSTAAECWNISPPTASFTHETPQ